MTSYVRCEETKEILFLMIIRDLQVKEYLNLLVITYKIRRAKEKKIVS